MHGERSPWYEREQEFIDGVRQLTSGQDNEVWSFGEDNYEILKKYLFIRERLRPYIRSCMEQASKTGAPVMRPLFFDFAEDKESWNVEDAYMFGPDLLVAPVMEAGETAEHAIVREIEEELNVEIRPEKFLHTVEYDYPNFHLTMHCFISVITKGTIELIEHEDAKWLKPDELDSVAWLPADVEVVEKLKIYLKEKNEL